jgi:beta-lactamase class A
MPADSPIVTPPALTALADELAAFPALVSVWCGQVGTTPAPTVDIDTSRPIDVARPVDTAGPADAATPSPAYVRLADARHYAASMMKVPVLAAMYRMDDAGALDLDEPVPVVNDFASAHAGAPNFAMDPAYDQDDAVWARLGGDATLRWLGRRMIVRSSNLATNLVLTYVGVGEVAEVLRQVGMGESRVERGIADTAGRMAGFDNLTSARDLAALFVAIARGADASGPPGGATHRPGGNRSPIASGQPGAAESPVATPPSCREMIEVLCGQEHRDDIVAGLPSGTQVALKNGWVTDVRHATGVVFPDDAPPYVLAICTTSGYARSDYDRKARKLIARIAAASWADRHELTPA